MGGKGRDRFPALEWRGLAVGHHRRARANAHDIRRGGTFFEAADKHGDIRALATSVGVQFVEDKKAQSVRPCLREQALIIRADKQ